MQHSFSAAPGTSAQGQPDHRRRRPANVPNIASSCKICPFGFCLPRRRGGSHGLFHGFRDWLCGQSNKPHLVSNLWTGRGERWRRRGEERFGAKSWLDDFFWCGFCLRGRCGRGCFGQSLLGRKSTSRCECCGLSPFRHHRLWRRRYNDGRRLACGSWRRRLNNTIRMV